MTEIQLQSEAAALDAYEKLTSGSSIMEVARELKMPPQDVIKQIRQHKDVFPALGKSFDNSILKLIEYERLEKVQVKLANLIDGVPSLDSFEGDEQAKILSSVGNVATAFTRLSERKAKIAGFDEVVETRQVQVQVTPERLLAARDNASEPPIIDAN